MPFSLRTTPHSLAMKTLRFFVNDLLTKPLQYLRQFVSPKPLPSLDFSFNVDFFRYAVTFLSQFKYVRSMHMVFPSSAHNCNHNGDSLFFKWTAKFGPTIDTFVFLSSSSIRVGTEFDFDEQEQEEDPQWTSEWMKDRAELAFKCFGVAVVWNWMLHFFIREHPLLQNIKCTDYENQGSLSLRDSRVVELRNWIPERTPIPVTVQQWHVQLLKLPVSRKVMMSATLLLMETAVRPHQGSRDWRHLLRPLLK